MSVLAFLEQAETAPAVLEAARRLAMAQPDAAVSALAVRMPPESTIMPTEEILTAAQAARIEAEEAERVAPLRHLAGAAGMAWEDVEGMTDAVVAARAEAAAFVVLARPRNGDAAARAAIHAALFEAHRPVLMVPPQAGPFGRIIAVAWRPGPSAEQAVQAALPLLTRADAVHVLAGVRDNAMPVLPPALAAHGIAAELHTLPIGNPPFGADLLARAHACGADLLVMGAFVRRPFSEWLPGGVTRYMLTHADLPVLMQHA